MKSFILALTLVATSTCAALAFENQQQFQGGTLYDSRTGSLSTITPMPGGGATIYNSRTGSLSTLTPMPGGGATIYNSRTGSFSTFTPMPSPQLHYNPFSFGK